MGGGGGGGGSGAGPARFEVPCALYLVASDITVGNIYDKTLPAPSDEEEMLRACGAQDCSATFAIAHSAEGLALPDDAKARLAEGCGRLASGDIRPRRV